MLALGCPSLTHLNLAFCGSAVSDSSMRSLGLHLLELRELSVRGCVRVTGVGVEAVVDGCSYLEVFDVSQCKNLTGWLEGGGVERVRYRNRGRGGRGSGGSGGSVMSGISGIGGSGMEVVNGDAGMSGRGKGGDGDGGIRFEVVADGRWRTGKY